MAREELAYTKSYGMSKKQLHTLSVETMSLAQRAGSGQKLGTGKSLLCGRIRGTEGQRERGEAGKAA